MGTGPVARRRGRAVDPTTQAPDSLRGDPASAGRPIDLGTRHGPVAGAGIDPEQSRRSGRPRDPAAEGVVRAVPARVPPTWLRLEGVGAGVVDPAGSPSPGAH